MSGAITDDRAARALLRHLADHRGKDDAVGELARALLSGEAVPRDLLRNSWFGEGLAEAAERGRTELSRMSREDLATIDDGAARLHRAWNTDEEAES
ncbi:hypothetical protein Aca07nite_78620 [Actinoplanes capillaceus]|uniref:Uncharacterized protein n=1 Tax=Actinoplanes campanulatus TaxID=113559 RepID=A0ABQ3WWC0_9ACTN|nr:hypothetical protein [Actinoplanes capillaceus]GID50587.1 hypothetical protein Aca07nite_78620 [Actinoplanes capillaceus]